MAALLLGQVGKEKVIVWAHNGHIGRGIGYPVLGDHLRKARQNGVYGVGLFARSGKWREHWTGQVKPWGAAIDGLENRFTADGAARFLPASRIDQEVTAFEPENGGQVRFRPGQRFDGLIVVDELSPVEAP